MYHHYFYWQFVAAPLWLVRLGWYLELVLLRFFSVPVMVKSLFAHWHKDAVSYNQGTISGILKAFGLNLISRSIGAIIRVSVLLIFTITQIIFCVVTPVVITLFLLWPFVIILTFYIGLSLVMQTYL
jgi:hypothetical protein